MYVLDHGARGLVQQNGLELVHLLQRVDDFVQLHVRGAVVSEANVQLPQCVGKLALVGHIGFACLNHRVANLEDLLHAVLEILQPKLLLLYDGSEMMNVNL